MKVAIVGASGFVGSAITRVALSMGHTVRGLVRCRADLPSEVEAIETGDLLRTNVSLTALEGCDAVINCVGRAHIMRETEADPEAAYRAANCELSVRLFRVAAKARVGRFVQVSSVAAVTSRTPSGAVVDDTSAPAPQSLYGRSKLEADIHLQKAARDGRTTLVSIRPPTLFGPGVSAYFRMLMRCANAGIPLPIGGIDNRRSFMFVSNLADAALRAAAADAEGCFIVTDSAPVSTAQLYRTLLRLYGRPTVVPRMPTAFVGSIARTFLGHGSESLIGNAAYDGSRFASTFRWAPPHDLNSALKLTIAA